MYPTIPNPWLYPCRSLETEFAKPYRGEVVLFRFPDDPSEIFVKRIIGLPGDTITIKNGKVYINGKELNEPYITQPTASGPQSTYHVPAGCYFMLGDNRSVSDDSRYWTHKYVPGEKHSRPRRLRRLAHRQGGADSLTGGVGLKELRHH